MIERCARLLSPNMGDLFEVCFTAGGSGGDSIESFLKYDPAHVEDFIDFLRSSELWQEAAERLALVLNDESFYSRQGKTRRQLWLSLCQLLSTHTKEVPGLQMEAIIRGEIRRFTNGCLWTTLADYYIAGSRCQTSLST